MKRIVNDKGFTLVELLIVIVIIGILAGVLISVINPAAQQNRARDAGVQAAINKVALAVEGFVSAYGRAPNDVEFLGAIQNAADCNAGYSAGGNCAAATCAGSDNECSFDIRGNSLRFGAGTLGCSNNNWSGQGANPCYYHYFTEAVGAGADLTHFRLYAASHGITNGIFVYDNKTAVTSQCLLTTVANVNTAGARDGDQCL